jgi:hypothetical protein
MTTYKIIHYTSIDPIGNTIHKTNTFNKTELQSKFDALVKRLKPGESVEYMKEDDKYFYPSMAYVENENGVLYAYTAKGHKVKSKHN